MEFWTSNTPGVFAWVCFVLMCIGAATVGRYFVVLFIFSYRLACLVLKRKP